jgi:MFS family permease
MGDGADRTNRPWGRVLAATMVLQMLNAYLYYLTPTLAPVLAARLGQSPAFVGWVTALGTAGSLLFLLIGTPLVRRFGPLRSLQAGVLLGGLGSALLLIPSVPAVVVANVLMGVGYGPASPAGSDLLQSFAPAGHRNLLFSVRQAGVTVSGLLAGLLLPVVYTAGGWSLVVGTTLALVLTGVLAVQPLRSVTDLPATGPDGVDRPRFGLAPLVALKRAGLVMLALAGACLGAGQACWVAYLVTWLHAVAGFSLVEAGLLFAFMQATGIFGRLVLGWLADRIGSPLPVLAFAILGSTVTTLAIAVGPDVPATPHLVLLAGAAGILVSSWNGIQVAAIAGRAPKDRIAECAAGATILVFTGFLVAPVVFALILAFTESFKAGFVAAAIMTALGLVCLLRVPWRVAAGA